MMQPDLLQQPSWPCYSITQSPNDQVTNGQIGDHGFSFSFTTTEEDLSRVSSDQFLSTIFSNEFLEYPVTGDDLQVTSLPEINIDSIDRIEPISGGEIEDVYRWLGEELGEGDFPSEQLSMEADNVWSPCQSTKSSEASVVFPSVKVSLNLPGDGMGTHNQLSIKHLLKAYGEAMEMDQGVLAEVIMKCIIEKVSPTGDTFDRLAFHLFQFGEKQGEYLKQEARKNYEAAFKAFYQIFPYGRFAHFTANLAIIETMPENADIVHIIDFDMRDGVQWPPMIEAIARRGKALRLTSIRTGEDCVDAPTHWRFEETKRRLRDHARYFGIDLKVEEVGIEDLVSEIRKSKKRGGWKEFFAFNCMVGLPHMGMAKSRSEVTEFLRVAKELLADSASNRGIITVGDGDTADRSNSCSGFSSFFDSRLNHYQALCESMEWNFPVSLAEARIAMETLFITPFVSHLSWLQVWENIRKVSDLNAGIGLKGLGLTKENLMEAKELVREKESSYTVKIEGHEENKMVLEWRGIPLVRVSAWR